MSAAPVMLAVLLCLAIAYRYYSAFLAAKVLALSPSAVTPAHRLADGHNYQPTSKWVLFGHHFAAISGAGPLIGPVLAAQFGYLPGLLWILIGVCLAGAVQDFLVLTLSSRHNGESLAQLAYRYIGKTGGTLATIAILFIIVVAMAGLGKVVVKALGGETIPATASMPARVIPGSSWGTFTIAATIPIAIFVGFWMFRFRKGHTVEASIIGGLLTLAATVAGGYVANSSFASYFNLTATQLTWAMAIYGFVASVLPVWILLCPRDYISSFLKIGTIALLVLGTLFANPHLQAPAINPTFISGGPVVAGKIFPFLFITVMCGAISGFHALVSSGTTSKMLNNETDARTIGYGAMLIEGLVGIVAMIAAASLTPADYYAMNTDLAMLPKFHDAILQVGASGGIEHLAQYEQLTQESLRGRTGGAVTLAVGMGHILLHNFSPASAWVQSAWKYWYHFAIMFEALFILTTIDAGTRIGRFLLQEITGKLHPALGLKGHWLASAAATAAIVLAWVWIMGSGNFATIWSIFGIANQTLAIIALAIVATHLLQSGKKKYAYIVLIPLLFVFTTTTSASISFLSRQLNTVGAQLDKTGFALSNPLLTNTLIQLSLNVLILGSMLAILLCAAIKILFRPSPKLKAEAAM